jgi:hypothetical protein
MFWIIFDTATKRDYYRDVHNLLALPIGDTIRYDYGPQHLSDQALARADSHDLRPEKALLVYAQSATYRKGTPSPPAGEPLPLEDSLWVPTRFALVERTTGTADRYFFDLKLAGYPDPSADAFQAIILPLVQAGDVPFNKWIALSELHSELTSMDTKDDSANWSKIVDTLSSDPSQFSGDNFWRISTVRSGLDPAVPILPSASQLQPMISDQRNAVDGRAIYHIAELDHLSFQIETRTAQPADEAEQNPPRVVCFAAPPHGPLSDLGQKSITIRRHSKELVPTEVGSTWRLSGQIIPLEINTLPKSDNYCVGPEVKLHFHVEKSKLRAWGGCLLGLFGFISMLVGGSDLVSTQTILGVALIGVGVMACAVACILLTGRIPLPRSS